MNETERAESPLVARVDRIVAMLGEVDDDELRASARNLEQRLTEPLRVAIAGRLKAGKSTLINALAGTSIAATDATECTQMVTWYRHGPEPLARAIMIDGPPVELPYRLGRKAIIDTGMLDGVLRLEVQAPVDMLRLMTIIDTPGTASVNNELSDRATSFLLSAPLHETPDVVVYLMRNAHEHDVQFLQDYAETLPADADPLRAICVLSRADEVGSGRADSMLLADVLAERIHDMLAAHVAAVHPVGGLLALASATLDNDDYTRLAALAREPIPVRERLTRSVGVFLHADNTAAVSAAHRRSLLDRLGLYGVRAAISLIASGISTDVDDLSSRLRRISGISELQDSMLALFAGRADVLRAARVLGAVEDLTRGVSHQPTRVALLQATDEARAFSHELSELDHLRDLRVDPSDSLADDSMQLLVRTLGGNGASAHQRLGLPSTATPPELEDAAFDLHEQLSAMHALNGSARRAREAALESLDHLLENISPANEKSSSGGASGWDPGPVS